MGDIAAVFLPDSSAAYEHWFHAHPNGYIINAHKTGSLPMVWPRVGCGHIEPDGVTKFIGGDYIKACTDDPGELALWAKSRKESLHYCADCRALGPKPS